MLQRRRLGIVSAKSDGSVSRRRHEACTKWCKRFMFDKRKIVSALCVVFCAIAIGVYRLDGFQGSCCTGINEATQAILYVVNTQSGASESSNSGETVWAYSLNFRDPCMLNLTEQKQILKRRTTDGSVVPIREVTHYLIPVADLSTAHFGRTTLWNARVLCA